jgi:geranylgeranyl pyrophosphate synthase
MAAAKTAALLGCACALSALFAGAHARQVKQLRAFGEQRGLAFQLIDDMLGIWAFRRSPESRCTPTSPAVRTRCQS